MPEYFWDICTFSWWNCPMLSTVAVCHLGCNHNLVDSIDCSFVSWTWSSCQLKHISFWFLSFMCFSTFYSDVVVCQETQKSQGRKDSTTKSLAHWNTMHNAETIQKYLLAETIQKYLLFQQCVIFLEWHSIHKKTCSGHCLCFYFKSDFKAYCYGKPHLVILLHS